MALHAFAKLYNPETQKAISDTIPLVYVYQKGLQTGNLALCYGVLEKVHNVYKSALPYASGNLLNLTKLFVRKSTELVQNRADADELQNFVLQAVAGMKKALAEH